MITLRVRPSGRLWALVTVLLVLSACTVDESGPGTGVTIDSPADGATVASSSVDVSGRVEAPDSVVAVTARSGDATIDCGLAGSSFTCIDVPLSTGANSITILVQHEDGTVVRRTVTVTVDSSAPTISLASPGHGGEVTSDVIDVRGTVSAPAGVADLGVRVDGAASGTCRVRDGEFICVDVLLEDGVNTIVVTATDSDGDESSSTATVTLDPAASSDGFDVTLAFFDHSFTSEEVAAFYEAADLWSRVITNDLQGTDVDFSGNEACAQGEPAYSDTIDDVVIFVTSFTQGAGDVLGLASPCRSRSSGPDVGTTMVGYMEFDTEDLEILADDGQLVDTIAHEMGHVLGIGTNWEYDPFGQLLDYTTADGAGECQLASGFAYGPYYTGLGGWAGFRAIGGSGLVPVENTGGLGTQCGHWREATFGNELMTGYLNQNMDNPISELTIRSLTDIGYHVDASEAEPYSLLALRGSSAEEGYPIGRHERLVPPRGGIDPATGELTPPRAAPR